MNIGVFKSEVPFYSFYRENVPFLYLCQMVPSISKITLLNLYTKNDQKLIMQIIDQHHLCLILKKDQQYITLIFWTSTI